MTPAITLLGTGGPRPDAARGATALLIETGDDAILIDAGRGAAWCGSSPRWTFRCPASIQC